MERGTLFLAEVGVENGRTEGQINVGMDRSTSYLVHSRPHALCDLPLMAHVTRHGVNFSVVQSWC